MKKRIKENINYTLATFAVEGLKPSRKAIRLYEEMSDGRRSLSDTLREIERQHGVTGDNHAP